MSAPKEHNYAPAFFIQPSTINHQYSPSLQDARNMQRLEKKTPKQNMQNYC